MALDPNDEYALHIWSFLKDFRKRRSEFIELARIARHSVEDLKRRPPTPDECERLYQGILLNVEIFRGILARKRFLLPSYYQAYALAFARYVLHNHWVEIRI